MCMYRKTFPFSHFGLKALIHKALRVGNPFPIVSHLPIFKPKIQGIFKRIWERGKAWETLFPCYNPVTARDSGQNGKMGTILE